MLLIKNITLIYLRLLFIMLLSIITSRYVFKNLGIDDYGIYNVIGGVVIIFAFFNNAMVAATQRFLSYNLGDIKKTIETFRISKSIHLLIALITFIFTETLGLYFINFNLNFDENRSLAINIAYQTSLFSMITMIITVPYVSIILVHQKVNFFALIGIIDASLKFILAYSLLFITTDKFIFYSITISLITVFSYFTYYFYALKKFSYIKNLKYIFSLKKMSEMFYFASWNLLGVFAGLGQNAGVNVLINIYFKQDVNASRALSQQIYSSLGRINSSLNTIYNPLIIKKFAKKENDTLNYIYFFSNFSFFVTSIVLIPLYFNLEFIIKIWLDTLPIYLDTFLKIIFIEMLLICLIGPLHSLIQAEGNIKWYQIIMSFFLLLNIPIGWTLYSIGFEPDSIYYVSLSLITITFILRLIILKKRMIINIKKYMYNTIFPIVLYLFCFLYTQLCVFDKTNKILILEAFAFLFLIYSTNKLISIKNIFFKLKDKLH